MEKSMESSLETLPAPGGEPAGKVPPSATRGYAGQKKRTNLSLDSELVEIATRHFKKTRHGSLSGFVESKLRSEFRALASALRQAGFTIPESVFMK
jgi:hypothetical protein